MFFNFIGLAVEEETNSTQAPPQISRKISRTSSVPYIQPSEQSTILDVGDLMECCELAELSNQVPLEKLSSPKEVCLQRNISFEEDSWDKLYNETGDLLRPDALEEVSKLFYIICLFEAVILFIYFPEL
jgi:hypothetical protein